MSPGAIRILRAPQTTPLHCLNAYIIGNTHASESSTTFHVDLISFPVEKCPYKNEIAFFFSLGIKTTLFALVCATQYLSDRFLSAELTNGIMSYDHLLFVTDEVDYKNLFFELQRK